MPLLIVSAAVLLRCRSAVLRWSVAALIPAAVAFGPGVLAGELWNPMRFVFAIIVAVTTWGSFVGAALRPFGGRASLAVVASVCVGILVPLAIFFSGLLYFGVTVSDVGRAIDGVEEAPWKQPRTNDR